MDQKAKNYSHAKPLYRMGLLVSLSSGYRVHDAGSLTKMYRARPVHYPEFISGKVKPVPETSCVLAAL